MHDSTWPALERARARGVRLGLCTGRIGRGRAADIARRVSADDLHVFQSGAVVSRPGVRAAFSSRLPAEAVSALVAVSRREREPLELYTELGFYLERENELTRVHARHLELEPERRDLLSLDEPPVRAQWVVSERDWPRFRDWTLAIGGLDVNPATAPWSPGTVFSNVTRAGTSKVSAMRWLAAHYGLGFPQIAMIGDGENDLDAIEAAGLGIAMGDSPDTVKRRARAVVAGVDAGGLAEAIALALTAE